MEVFVVTFNQSMSNQQIQMNNYPVCTDIPEAGATLTLTICIWQVAGLNFGKNAENFDRCRDTTSWIGPD